MLYLGGTGGSPSLRMPLLAACDLVTIPWNPVLVGVIEWHMVLFLSWFLKAYCKLTACFPTHNYVGLSCIILLSPSLKIGFSPFMLPKATQGMK